MTLFRTALFTTLLLVSSQTGSSHSLRGRKTQNIITVEKFTDPPVPNPSVLGSDAGFGLVQGFAKNLSKLYSPGGANPQFGSDPRFINVANPLSNFTRVGSPGN